MSNQAKRWSFFQHLSSGVVAAEPVSISNKPAKPVIAIVGVGTGGLSLFIQLIKNAGKDGGFRDFSILLLEKNPIAGPGRPWYPTQNYVLRVNDRNSDMMIMIDEPHDFVTWLKKGEFQRRHPELAETKAAEIAEDPGFAPRALFGMYCVDRLNDYVEKAKALGIPVNIEENTEVVKNKKLADGRWSLLTEDGREFQVDYLSFMLGHFSSGALKHLRGHPKAKSKVISPFKDAFHQVSWRDLGVDQRVIIVGTSLTAVDIANMLTNAGFLGEMLAISRSARFSLIKDPAFNELKNPPTENPYQLKYLTEEAVKAKPTLDNVLELTAKELSYAMQMPLTKDTMLDIARKTGDKPIDTFYKELGSVLAGKHRQWLRALNQTYFKIQPSLQLMSPEDKKKYVDVIYRLYLKVIAGMTPINAEKLLFYFENGDLIAKQAEDVDLSYDETAGNFIVRTKDGKTFIAAYVINAAGIGKDPHGNPLTRFMIENGMCCADPLGGITVDPVNFRVKAKDGSFHDNCFAYGPIIFGCDFSCYSVERGAANGKTVAEALLKMMASKQAKLGEQPKQMQKHASVTPASQVQNLKSAVSAGQVDLNEGSQGFRARL